jgi:hypothetical protein
MIAFTEFKLLIGSLAEKLSDDEIEELRVMGYQIADSVVEKWFVKSGKDLSLNTLEGYNMKDIEF